MRNLLAQPSPGASVNWVKWVPPKVVCVAWKLALKHIPHSDNLTVSTSSLVCPLCCVTNESRDHVFFACMAFKLIFEGIMGWCNWDLAGVNGVQQLLDKAAAFGNLKSGKKLVWYIIYLVFWILWKNRNNGLFNKR